MVCQSLMKLFKHKHPFIIIIILVTLLFLFAAKAYYDTNSIEVRHYQIKDLTLAEVLGGLKVAHLSDLHIKSMGLMVGKIQDILDNEKPDLIFVTGDSISFEGPYEPLLSFFHELRAPYGVYGVLGNTEYSNENGSCILCHEEKSKKLKEKQTPIFLRNSLSELTIDGKIINVLGLDDPVNKKNNLEAVLKHINSENPSILLAHSPEIFEEASEKGADLLLCGHTHGGQIFITRYLRKIFPLIDPALEFLDGFFKKSKTLMYVSRGIGTSYFPFRFGPKPEITFFSFSVNSTNTSNSSSPLQISNIPSTTIFTGFNLSSFIETFNISSIFRSIHLTSARTPNNRAAKPMNPSNLGNATKSSNSIDSNTLFDFESEEELKQLNWECHKWFELSQENATSGKYSLKVLVPPGQYPGINFKGIRDDWSGFRNFKMDVFNPSEEEFNFHIRIDDNKSGWDYANRFDADFNLKPGINNISIPIDSIRTNLHRSPLNLKRVRRMMVFLINNTKQKELYVDNIRLE